MTKLVLRIDNQDHLGLNEDTPSRVTVMLRDFRWIRMLLVFMVVVFFLETILRDRVINISWVEVLVFVLLFLAASDQVMTFNEVSDGFEIRKFFYSGFFFSFQGQEIPSFDIQLVQLGRKGKNPIFVKILSDEIDDLTFRSTNREIKKLVEFATLYDLTITTKKHKIIKSQPNSS